MNRTTNEPSDVGDPFDELESQAAEGLITVGNACGDDESLMLAKAQRLQDLIREILEKTPPLQITAALPSDLSAEQRDVVTSALRDAASAGMRLAAGHAAASLANAMYDLCTSRLKQNLH